MKEYKFRLFDKVHNKYIPGGAWTLKDLIRQDIFIDYGINNLDIEQFTGLKDDNGKELYEGDIFKLACGDNKPSKIEYPDDYYWFREYGLIDGENNELIHGVIIGNIHENPELVSEAE